MPVERAAGDELHRHQLPAERGVHVVEDRATGAAGTTWSLSPSCRSRCGSRAPSPLPPRPPTAAPSGRGSNRARPRERPSAGSRRADRYPAACAARRWRCRRRAAGSTPSAPGGRVRSAGRSPRPSTRSRAAVRRRSSAGSLIIDSHNPSESYMISAQTPSSSRSGAATSMSRARRAPHHELADRSCPPTFFVSQSSASAPEALAVDVHDLVPVELLTPRHARRELLRQDLVPHRALAE